MHVCDLKLNSSTSGYYLASSVMVCAAILCSNFTNTRVVNGLFLLGPVMMTCFCFVFLQLFRYYFLLAASSTLSSV